VKNSLLYFSISILVLNLIFIIIAVANNFVGFFGALVGGSAAILTDPVILVVGILGGVALATQRIKFAVIALVVGAIIAAVVVHFILGTTRFIVDVVRVNVFLIIPSIIILIASGFNKLTNKTIKKKPLAKKVKTKIDKDSNKGLRFSVLIFSVCIIWVLLFYKTVDKSLIGENITEHILKPFYTKSKIQKCEYNTRLEKDPLSGLYDGKYTYSEVTKTRCSRIDIDEFIRKNSVTKQEVAKYIKYGTTLTSSLKKAKTMDVVGNFWLQKRYSTNFPGMWKGKIRLHYVLFIISVLFIWRLRFCITAVTANLFNKIKSEI